MSTVWRVTNLDYSVHSKLKNCFLFWRSSVDTKQKSRPPGTRLQGNSLAPGMGGGKPVTAGLVALSPACSLIRRGVPSRPAPGRPFRGLPSWSARTAGLPALPLNSLVSSG